MRYGINGRRRVEAAPQSTADCPLCEAELIPKCGKVNAWHWAHEVADCDTWAEPDSEWHRSWQEQFPEPMREVAIGAHRADLLTPSGVVEVQHSYLSTDEIRKRENHYGEQMRWIWDARKPFAEGRFLLRRGSQKEAASRYRSFRWKHARKTIAACDRAVYLDLSEHWLLLLGRMYTEEPRVGGWGHLRRREAVVGRLVGDGTTPARAV